MKIETLDDLLYEELRELYDEEERLVQALPKMARNSASEQLRQAFEKHLGQTLEHVNRLEQCFRELGKHAGGETVNAMKGLIKDGERTIDAIPLSPLRDAALIGAAKRVEHYEIAAYTGVISFARMLGLESIAAGPDAARGKGNRREADGDRRYHGQSGSPAAWRASAGAKSMSPKAHSRKVTGEATKKKAKSPFRCNNCGATFVSQAEKQAHEDSKHGSGGKSGK
jgi:ferritin-like metal-binding protein YciE